jgi:hypothetical protein
VGSPEGCRGVVLISMQSCIHGATQSRMPGQVNFSDELFETSVFLKFVPLDGLGAPFVVNGVVAFDLLRPLLMLGRVSHLHPSFRGGRMYFLRLSVRREQQRERGLLIASPPAQADGAVRAPRATAPAPARCNENRVRVMCTGPARCCSPRLQGGRYCLEWTLLTLVERCVVLCV